MTIVYVSIGVLFILVVINIVFLKKISKFLDKFNFLDLKIWQNRVDEIEDFDKSAKYMIETVEHIECYLIRAIRLLSVQLLGYDLYQKEREEHERKWRENDNTNIR